MKALKIIGFAGALLLAGCVDNYVSIEVLGAKPYEIDIVSEEDGMIQGFCVLPDHGGELQLSQGWTDFENDNYTFRIPFEIRNNLPPTDTDVGRLDTSAVTIERAIISYRGLPGHDQHTDALSDFDTVVYMTAVMGSGDTLMAEMTLIPAFRGRAIQSAITPQPGDVETIIASFSIEGRTNAGRQISTGTIDFPITVGFQSGICQDGRCDCYRSQE